MLSKLIEIIQVKFERDLLFCSIHRAIEKTLHSNKMRIQGIEKSQNVKIGTLEISKNWMLRKNEFIVNLN